MTILGPGYLGAATYGLQITGGARHVVRGVTNAQIVLTDVVDSRVEENGLQYVALKSRDGVAERNAFVRNNFGSGGTLSIAGCAARNNVVTGNRWGQDTPGAIRLSQGATETLVQDNEITVGTIELWTTHRNRILDNRVLGSWMGQDDRVWLMSDGSVCPGGAKGPTRNTISRNLLVGGTAGITLYNGAGSNRLDGNTIIRTPIGIHFRAGAYSNRALDNQFFDVSMEILDEGLGNQWP